MTSEHNSQALSGRGSTDDSAPSAEPLGTGGLIARLIGLATFAVALALGVSRFMLPGGGAGDDDGAELALAAIDAGAPAEQAPPPAPIDRGPDRLAAALAQLPTQARPKVPRGAASDALQAVGRSVGAQGGSVEDPCIAWVGPTCTRRALSAFFAALDKTGNKEATTRISVFGNSLIASDRIIDIWRDRFVERFGDGGRGFLLADRMAPYGGRARTGVGVRGLETYNIAQGPFGPWPHGLTGILHFSSGYARTTWWLKGARHARLFWLDHKDAPPLEVSIDDGAPTVVEPTQTGKGRMLDVLVPAGAKALRLKVPRGQAVLYGATLENQEPGVIVDTLGVVASDSTIFLKEDEALFTQHLQAADPDLVAILLGGNETKRIAWGKSSAEQVRDDLHGFIRRIRKVSPASSCLVVGPIENVRGKGKSRAWTTRWQMFLVNSLMKEVALEEGCAWFDLFEAMGGRGQLKRLNARNLLHDDMVHPKGKGLDLPGELISDALLDAYEATPRGRPLVEVQSVVESMVAASPASPASLAASALGTELSSAAHRGPVAVGVRRAQAKQAARVFSAIEAHLAERFGTAGSPLLPVEALEEANTPGAAALHLWRATPGFKVTSGKRELEVLKSDKTSSGWSHAVVDLTKAGSWKLERRPGEVVWGRELDRYPGVVIDDLSTLPAPVAKAVEHPLRLVAAGSAAASTTGGTCLALVLPGGAAAGEGAGTGCPTYDVVSEHGGRALWEAKGLVKGDALTDLGVDAAVRLLTTALFGARPTGAPVDRPG